MLFVYNMPPYLVEDTDVKLNQTGQISQRSGPDSIPVVDAKLFGAKYYPTIISAFSWKWYSATLKDGHGVRSSHLNVQQ